MNFAGSRQCKCPRWDFNPTGQAKRELVVIQRNQHRSSWGGTAWGGENTAYYGRPARKSKWSHVLCLTCGHHWRTQAHYVDRLPDLSEEGRQFCYHGLKQGKPAGRLLLAKICDSYNRPLFGAGSSPSAGAQARFSPAKAAIGGRSRR